MRVCPNFTTVSSNIVASRQVFLLDVPFGGGFFVGFRRCALGVGFRRYPESEKVLEFLTPLIYVKCVVFGLLAN